MTIEQALQQYHQNQSNRLDLKDNLKEFPEQVFELADTLEILDLSGNQLSALPDDLPRLHRLRILFCSNNLFTELPEVLGRCENLSMVGFKSNQIENIPAASLGKSLRWLILTDNHIRELPESIGECTKLQKLMLAGNRLSALPDAIKQCRQLELVRIAANQFASLPECLLELPRLSWLAYAGNPCSGTDEKFAEDINAINIINWESLEIAQKLGEGASGFIYRATWHQVDTTQNVAVKLFKGDITSDGLPQSEKAACIRAGTHPNLIPVHGKIDRHPQGSSGLIMSLIDPAFRTLALPPSLESCTRDVYPEKLQFSFANICRMAYELASTAHHLHNKGIMHGDFYAHNILHDGSGNCLLGDFGAASFLPEDAKLAAKLQQIEVRAFGCLLEELIAQCTDNLPDNHPLRLLHQRCIHEEKDARPTFAELLQAIAVIQNHLD